MALFGKLLSSLFIRALQFNPCCVQRLRLPSAWLQRSERSSSSINWTRFAHCLPKCFQWVPTNIGFARYKGLDAQQAVQEPRAGKWGRRAPHWPNRYFLFSYVPGTGKVEYEEADRCPVLNGPFSSSQHHKPGPRMSGMEIVGLVITLVDLGRRIVLAVKDVSS